METKTQIQETKKAEQKEKENMRTVLKMSITHNYDEKLGYTNSKLEIVAKACFTVLDMEDDREECGYDDYDGEEQCGELCFTSVKEMVVRLDGDDVTQLLDEIVKIYDDVVADAVQRRNKFINNREKLLKELEKSNIYIQEII